MRVWQALGGRCESCGRCGEVRAFKGQKCHMANGGSNKFLQYYIEMPHLNGMEAAKKIYETDKEVIIIFITNLEQYAVQGYQIEALGYLLKPITYSRLSDIMDKSVRKTEARTPHETILLSSGLIVRVPVMDILYIEVIGHILTYHTAYGNYQMRGKLSELEKQFAPYGFARCNKGYLVNLAHVKSITHNVVQVGGEELLISRGKSKQFNERFLEYLSLCNS